MKKIFVLILLLAIIGSPVHAAQMYTVDVESDPDPPTNYEMVDYQRGGPRVTAYYFNQRWESIDGRLHILETYHNYHYGNVYFDDGDGDSPWLIFRDEDDNAFSIYKLDAGPAVLANNEGGVVIMTNSDTDDYWYFSVIGNEPNLTVVGTTSMNFGGIGVTDLTVMTNGTGDSEVVLPNDSIGNAELNWAALASTSLNDTADLLYEAELDEFSELQAQIADKTLVNEEDAATFDALMTFDLGLTITTGDPLTLGVVRWDDGSDQIDGEQIADNTIDKDSIDWQGLVADQILNFVDFRGPSYGTDNNYLSFYNESYDIWNIYTAEADSTNVDYGMFTFAVDSGNAGLTANQEVFEIGKGASNASGGNWVELFAVDEDGDGTFAGNIIGDSVIPSAASFPTGVNGALFYHTTHKILFQYENSMWNPLAGYASTLNLYVNETSGSDAIGKGFASGASATATIQYCIDKCIPALNYGNVIINITAETYSEDVTIQGRESVGGDYTIKMLGTFAEELAEATVDAGSAQGTGATQGTLVDAGPAWVDNAFNGMWVVFSETTDTAALQGIIRLIDRTTDAGDVLTICGTWPAAPVADDTYTIQDQGTIVDSITLGQGQKNIRLERIHMLLQSTSVAPWGYGAEGTMHYCKISHATGATVSLLANSTLFSYFSYFEKVRMYVNRAHYANSRNKHQTGYSTACIQVSYGGYTAIGAGTVIDGADAGGRDGVYLTGNCYLATYAPAATGYVRIRNCADKGIEANAGSGNESTTNIQWGAGGDVNGTDKIVDGATMAWDLT